MSVLSIPRAVDKLGRLVEERWADLKDIESFEVAKYATAPARIPVFAEFPTEQIWQAMQAKRQQENAPDTEEEDLKAPEWEVLTVADAANVSRDFKLRKVDPPIGFESYFADTVLVERLREVRSLLGFTRIESNGDFADAAYVTDGRSTPLSRQSPTWLPVSEVRGEGIFLRLKEDVLTSWETQPAVMNLAQDFFLAHKMWRLKRHLRPSEAGFPGMRFVLLHSLAHALMRQIALECGYTAASLRERIYCRMPGQEQGPMAGILLYTSATDSEGTLGGLVGLGEPLTLSRHLQQVLEHLSICASDPLCAEHPVSPDGRGIHAASCHACLFAPETSCERGNRYLDRNTLIQTFAEKSIGFFTSAV